MSIWETLGIEATTDERAIKRAYAKQLKSFRPDEDPAYFQKLREARDDAIFHAKYDYAWNEEEWNEEDWDEEEPDEENPQTVKSHTTAAQNSEHHEQPQPSADIYDIFEFTRKNDQITEPITEPISEPTIQQEISQEATVEPIEPQKNTPDQPDIPRNFQAIEIEDITHDDIDNELETLFSPWCEWNQEQWKSLINKARDCTFDLSTYTEFEILGALSDHFVKKPKLSEYERAKRNYILSYLNEEYGWTQNDRRIYSILTDEQADLLMDHIRGTFSEDGMLNGEKFYDTLGFPLLTPQHFKNFLGKNDTIYEYYYQDCLKKGHVYQKSWSWLGFIFPPLWLAHRCNDGLEALTSISYVIGAIIIYHGHSHANIHAFIAGIAAIITMHFFTGIYGKRLVIGTMATTLTELEEDKLMTEEDKLKKMASIGRGGIKGIYDLVAGMLGIALILVAIYQIFIA